MNFVKRGLETVLWENDVKLYMSGTPRFLLARSARLKFPQAHNHYYWSALLSIRNRQLPKYPQGLSGSCQLGLTVAFPLECQRRS